MSIIHCYSKFRDTLCFLSCPFLLLVHKKLVKVEQRMKARTFMKGECKLQLDKSKMFSILNGRVSKKRKFQ